MVKGIQKIFSEVPHTYELVNHILTLGQDVSWRSMAARFAALEGGTRWMDVCSGTGEMAVNLGGLAGGKTTVVATDFSAPMIKKASSKPESDSISFTIANATNLPFPDDTFDLVTISFATRNINVSRGSLIQCFQEFNRVLKPGGRFVNLETSQPESHILRRLFHLYVRLFVRRAGLLISGSRSGYTYLSNTIPRFYGAEELADIIRQAGFEPVNYKQMLFGVAAIHKGIKP